MSVKVTSASNNNLQRPSDDAALAPAQLTIACWIKMHVVSGTQDLISKSGVSSDLSYGWRLTSAGILELGTSTDGTSFNTTSSVSTIVVDTCYHLCMTHSTTAKTLYINGVQDATGAGPGALFNSTVALHIGDRTDGANNSNFFMEDLRFYNRALSQAEVETIFACQGTDGIMQGGIARYQMDEGAPGVIIGETAHVKDVWNNALHLSALGTTRPSWEEGLIVHARRRRAA